MTLADLSAKRPRNRPAKIVPQLYETDATRYAGPHRAQTWPAARWLRARLAPYAYGRHAAAFTEVVTYGTAHLAAAETGPCIFVANHTSHLDTILTHRALPDRVNRRLFYGAAQDRWFVKGRRGANERRPLYQSFVMGTFPILRGGGVKALEYASELLDRGMHIFLFPEGTRATSASLGAFKHGATLLALRHQAPLVPLYLEGLRAIRPKGARSVQPGPVALHVLAPHRPSPGSDVAATTERLFRAMNRVHLERTAAEEISAAA